MRRLNRSGVPEAACSGKAPFDFLRRYGVAAEFHDDGTGLAIDDALLASATDLGCDLVVMGAYGHSQVRESLVGGTTRTALASMTIPVLMARVDAVPVRP